MKKAKKTLPTDKMENIRAALTKRIPGIEQHFLLKELEVSLLTGTPRGTLSRWRVQGKGPRYTKLEGSVRYYLTDVLQYVERNTRLSVHNQMKDDRKQPTRWK